MKLRLQGNAIRLRLSQSDVSRLAATGRLEEMMQFPGGATFAWILTASTTVREPQASSDGDAITVLIPAAEAGAWASSAEVGMYSAPGAAGPSISIEKDFQCLHDPTGSRDNADSFPNPAARS